MGTWINEKLDYYRHHEDEKVRRNFEIVIYVFFGGLTTLVNLVMYFLLCRLTPLGINENTQAVANTISVFSAIVFAFVTNSIYVFESDADSFKEHMYEFAKFFGARLSTMVIEVGGVYLFVTLMKMNDMVAKIIIQFVVIVLNYFFSKFLVFVKKDKKD